MDFNNTNNITGIILAGGKARRMGGEDKGLIEINGQAMISYVINSLKPQVNTLLINANRNIQIYEQYGYPVIIDQLADFQGPLAGIAATMKYATTKYICSCPCDGPLIPKDLVKRLYSSLIKHNGEISVAHNGERMQPVYALIECGLFPSLKEYLESGERKIDQWYATHKLIEVDFSDKPGCFMNLNTPEDQIAFSKLLEKN